MEIIADYQICSTWDFDELDIDEEQVEHYFVKWDELNVKFKGQDDYVIFQPTGFAASDFDWKQPVNISEEA